MTSDNLPGAGASLRRPSSPTSSSASSSPASNKSTTCTQCGGNSDAVEEGTQHPFHAKRDVESPCHCQQPHIQDVSNGLANRGSVRSKEVRPSSRVFCRLRKYALIGILGGILLLNLVPLMLTEGPILPPSEDHGLLSGSSQEAITSSSSSSNGLGTGTKGKAGVWDRSYKLLSDGFHQFRHQAGWGRGAAGGDDGDGGGGRPPIDAEGSTGIVVAPSSTARCSFPDQSPIADFVLSGQGFNRIPSPNITTLRPRGIVISASGTVERLAIGAYVTSYLIRRVFGSNLPIEIYYVSEREIFDPTLKMQIEALGDVEVLDLVKVLQDKYGELYRTAAGGTKPAAAESNAGNKWSYLNPSIEQLASYAAKPYSILASSFKENILFDAGAVPFLDPKALLTLTTYTTIGYTEFRDYVPSSPHKWDWIPEEFCVDTNAVSEFFDGTEGDSSCVVFDKTRNWDALLVTTILNGPLQHITYQKLNGDKDTWVMAMVYTRGRLNPLETVPGFLFVDYEGNNLGRKVHGQLQLLKVDQDDQDYTTDLSIKPISPHPEKDEGGLIPLYFNNQLFNFTQWQYNKGWTYVGSYDDYGSLYNPPTSLSPDCIPYPVENLDPLTHLMVQAFDGVVDALASIESKHCCCRDDWASQCVYFIY